VVSEFFRDYFFSFAIASSHSRIFAANFAVCPESAGINVP